MIYIAKHELNGAKIVYVQYKVMQNIELSW